MGTMDWFCTSNKNEEAIKSKSIDRALRMAAREENQKVKILLLGKFKFYF
jgi:hypothetical protein